MWAPANLKAYMAAIFVGAIISAIPFNNKILLTGIISPIIIKLTSEIQKNNSFLLVELINKNPSSWIQHPWIITIIFLVIWGCDKLFLT